MKNAMIAKILREYRKKNDLSVKQVSSRLAEKSLSVAEKTIYGWESGQTQPDADTFLILYDIYNIDDILGTFGYTQETPFYVTNKEKEMILQLRRHPEMQDAVNKLLND